MHEHCTRQRFLDEETGDYVTVGGIELLVQRLWSRFQQLVLQISTTVEETVRFAEVQTELTGIQKAIARFQHIIEQTMVSTEYSVTKNAALVSTIKAMEQVDFRWEVLGLCLPQTVQQLIGTEIQHLEQDDEFQPFEATSKELQTYVSRKAADAATYCATRQSGKRYLNRVSNSLPSRVQVTVADIQELEQLEQQLSAAEGDGAAMIWMIFIILDGDLDQLRQLVASQLTVYKKNSPPDIPSFCEHVQQSLAVYADITEGVIEQVDEQEVRYIFNASKDVMRTIFQDQRLCSNQPVHNESKENLFTMLNEYLTQEKVKTPWLVRSLRNTPFSERMAGKLFTFDVPREAITQVFVYLNHAERFDGLRELYELKEKLETICGKDTDESFQEEMRIEAWLSRVSRSMSDAELDEALQDIEKRIKRLQRRMTREAETAVDSVQEEKMFQLIERYNTLKKLRSARVRRQDGWYDEARRSASQAHLATWAEHDLETGTRRTRHQLEQHTLGADAIAEVEHQEMLARIAKSPHKNKKIYERFCTLVKAMDWDIDLNEPLSEVLKKVNSQFQKQSRHPLCPIVVDTKLPKCFPMHALIRMLDPEKIANDRSERHEVQTAAQKYLHEFLKGQGQGDEANEHTWSAPDNTIAKPLLGQEARILAESVLQILKDAELELDVPISKFQSRGKEPLARSLRDVIQDVAKIVLHPDMIRYGPAYNPQAAKSAETIGQPIFPPTYATYRRDERHCNNFAMTGGNPTNERTIEVAKAILDKSPEDRWQRALRIFRRECRRYFRAPGYNFYPYANARAAFSALLDQWFPSSRQTHQIIGNQEYGEMTDSFGSNVSVIYINGKNGSKTPDDIFNEVLELKNHNSNTDMILFSLDTRFGDALCSCGNGKPNDYHVARLGERLQNDERTKNIAFVLDVVPTVGSTFAPNFSALNADAVIISGGKGLKVPPTGALAMSKYFEQKMQQRRDRPFKENPSTLLAENIVAMALRLQMLISPHNPMDLEAELTRPTGRPYEHDVAKHLRRLTSQAIKRAESFGADFVQNYVLADALTTFGGIQLRWDPQLVGRSLHQLESDFGCQVCEPQHRHFMDFTNAITVAFPTMNGKRLRRQLERQFGLLVEPVHFRGRAVRIKFDVEYHRTTDCIDDLFNAIQHVQMSVLLDDLKHGRNIRCVHNLYDLPDND